MLSLVSKTKASSQSLLFKRQIMRTAFTTLLFFAASSLQTFALDNRLASTPPMGWNSWNSFQLAIDEGKVRAMADFMFESGMKDAGYQYVVVDAGLESKYPQRRRQAGS